ncbi:hypothetical protein ACFC09_42255 [Streptomyces sp. NPDC056161]|uniref:hypothetical protein n=1 Tax=Streptomyces sp. NPDC056161 TaxID=3345732 RepID=UPI0035E34BE6
MSGPDERTEWTEWAEWAEWADRQAVRVGRSPPAARGDKAQYRGTTGGDEA